VIEQLAKDYAGKIDIYGMNCDENPDTPSTLGVMSIPVTIFYKGGKEVARIVGGTKAKLEETIKKVVG
jgi:thioredoxin 1